MRLKLVSYSHDTLLGHIDVPDEWRDWFERGVARMSVMPKRWEYKAEALVSAEQLQIVTIMKAYGSQYPDAVAIVEGSIEEFEKLPGCSFTPSAAYLRSHLID